MKRNNAMPTSRTKLLVMRSVLGRQRESSFVILKKNILCLKVCFKAGGIM